MSVLRYYACTDLCFRILGSLACNIVTFYLLSLVLCCDIYRSTLISIMYPACMITVHGRKSRALQEIGKKGFVLGVSSARGKYRRRGAPGGPTSQPGGWRGLGWGR